MELISQLLSAHLPLLASGFAVLCCFLLIILVFVFFQLRESGRILQRKSRLVTETQKNLFHLREERTQHKVHIARLVTLLKNEKKHGREKVAMLEEAREKLRLQFQSLANQIFDENSKKFSLDNKERLSGILRPLEEQLQSFRKRVDDIQVNDVKERMSLKKEIIHLRELNQQMSKEATNLAQALQGDKKAQGSWGELVLERVLERSGLRKGFEYSAQGGFRDSENKLLKPDVIVHLPDNRSVIIDSKVSLIAWEKYIRCDEKTQKKQLLLLHVQAVRNHITALSTKDYSDLRGVNSLDFVLLFMPIDPSFSAVFEEDEQLFADAFESRIIVVTPSTLLATLKTIENLWRYERQNQNSKEIAERAGAIYNKLSGFIEDMEKIGKQLAGCTMTYDSAMTRLVKGRGNVISQASQLTELGVKVKKEIPRSIMEISGDDVPN